VPWISANSLLYICWPILYAITSPSLVNEQTWKPLGLKAPSPVHRWPFLPLLHNPPLSDLEWEILSYVVVYIITVTTM
jgi:hypothetical protein